MSQPKAIDELMVHLIDDCNVQINGDLQKQQLTIYGYYHGYKGYRFYQSKQNRIPYSTFEEVVAVIEYDNNLKSALYSNLMFIETALKNIICAESVTGLNDSTFEEIFRINMHDRMLDVKLQSERLKLRNTVYSKISQQYQSEDNRNTQMVRHFINRGEDTPIWVIFEFFYLGELARFFNCLNAAIREEIMRKLNILDISIDTDRKLISQIIFTLKPLRNAVAHNNIIFDARFKDRRISPVLKLWVQKETGISNISLDSLIDYIIIICCLLKHVDFSTARAKKLLFEYKKQNEILASQIAPSIYETIINDTISAKIEALKAYI